MEKSEGWGYCSGVASQMGTAVRVTKGALRTAPSESSERHSPEGTALSESHRKGTAVLITNGCLACSNAPMPFTNARACSPNPLPTADIYASFFSTAGATPRFSSSTLGVLQRRRILRQRRILRVRRRRALRTPALLPSPPW